ncbi:cation:proton antiporter [Candidatus Pacearchaeota archaeon]|nr:cation:proton antiporter [Candidatus Pacearchaeota archaeon]
MQEVLLLISLILGVASFVTILTRLIKQPPIIAYLIAGVLVGPLFFNFISPGTANSESIQLFAHMGIALLLFIVGLSLDIRVLKEIGIVSTFAGLTEVTATALCTFAIALALGFNSVPALYLAVALSFSSTVLVVKILSDKKEMDTLHARIAVGILIVEDFVAAIALMVVPALQSNDLMPIMLSIGKAIIVIFLIFVFSLAILQKALHYLAASQEVLFLFGIAWALLIASLFDYLGFSLEIGALIAGMSLASSRYTLELGGKIKPLRDFFIVLFFVFFGSQLTGTITGTLIMEAIILSAFIIVGKPLIIMSILRLFGYKKRTNFLTGASLAQISEFSLILVLLGYTQGILPQELMSLAVLISLITIGVSSYSIYYAHSIFDKISHLLNIFEGKRHERRILEEESFDVVLFGYHRIGQSLLQALQAMNKKFIVVDYNPKTIIELSRKGINCVYGDARDREFVSELKLNKASFVISTIPDSESNITIKERMEEIGSKAIFIATAEHMQTALDLYEKGVDYVVIPHLLGGKYLASMLGQYKLDSEKYKHAGKEHTKELKKEAKGYI